MGFASSNAVEAIAKFAGALYVVLQRTTVRERVAVFGLALAVAFFGSVVTLARHVRGAPGPAISLRAALRG